MLRLVTHQCRLRPTSLREQILRQTPCVRCLSTDKNEVPDIPESADVVILGGGSAGCNTLYQLAKNGIKAVLLERKKITAGATWHNTGLIWSIKGNALEMQLLNASRNIVTRIQEETGVDPNWNNNGGVYVARTKERFEELKRFATIAKSFNIPATLMTPEEATSVFPLINPSVIVGALFSPNDGTADPSALCTGLTTGAIAAGARVIENCPVHKIISEQTSISGTPKITGVLTPYGLIKTNTVVNCSGAWAAETAKLAGLTLPLCAFKHTYVVSESMPTIQGLPNICDPDSSIYIRINNDNMYVGGFEKNPDILEEMPKDFAFDLFELDWAMFQQHSKKAAELVPAFETAGVKSSVCGPHCFTPDLMPLVGEDPRMRGMYHNVGFNSAGFMLSAACGEQLAKWIINGRPDFHMYSCDVRRFTPEQTSNMAWAKERSHECYVKKYSISYPHDQYLSGRNLKQDPFFEELLAAGAFYEEMQAYERPGWFTPQGYAPVPPYDWYGAYGTPKNKDRRYVDLLKGDYSFKFSKHHYVIGAECLACREHVVMFDISYFSKLYLCGPDTQVAADWLFTADTNTPLGQTVYCCMLNKHGGIESDIKVTAIHTGSGTQADPVFKGKGMYLVSGGASASQTWAHISSEIEKKKFKVSLTNMSGKIGLLALQGPKSRDLLQTLVDVDLSNEVFPYMTARVVKVAGRLVRAMRTSFVGELGWELHIPWQSCLPVYNAIWEHGINFGLRQAGYRALYSLSAEKGNKLWNSDLQINDNPIEAGMEETLRYDGDYLGKDALLEANEKGIQKKLAFFTVKEQVPLWGLEPIFRDSKLVGYLRRGEYGYSLGSSVGAGYISNPTGEPISSTFLKNGDYQIEVMGKKYDAKMTLKSPLDPENKRVHGIYDELLPVRL